MNSFNYGGLRLIGGAAGLISATILVAACASTGMTGHDMNYGMDGSGSMMGSMNSPPMQGMNDQPAMPGTMHNGGMGGMMMDRPSMMNKPMNNPMSDPAMKGMGVSPWMNKPVNSPMDRPMNAPMTGPSTSTMPMDAGQTPRILIGPMAVAVPARMACVFPQDGVMAQDPNWREVCRIMVPVGPAGSGAMMEMEPAGPSRMFEFKDGMWMERPMKVTPRMEQHGSSNPERAWPSSGQAVGEWLTVLGHPAGIWGVAHPPGLIAQGSVLGAGRLEENPPLEQSRGGQVVDGGSAMSMRMP
jgi:hypothetical protein